MMRRTTLILSLLLLPFACFSQFEYFNSETFWERMPLLPAGVHADIHPDDTVIIMATNRLPDNSSFRYLPEKRDGSGIRYFVVYSGGGKWQVLPVSNLKTAVSLLPDKNRDWVVYTEGMGKFFTSCADRGMNMSAQYGVNVIMLDYPSLNAHKKQLGNYFFSKKNASLAYHDFVPVLDTVRMLQESGQLGNKGVNLFFHSMGNIVLRQIIRRGKLGILNTSQWVNNLVLNAPCIPQHGHKKLLDQVRFARRMYVHYNPADYTLGGAYLVSKRYQLGKQVRNPISQKATYINFNMLAGAGHSNFLNLAGRNEVPQAALRHYNILLHGNAVPVADTHFYRPTAYRSIGFNLLPNHY